MTRHPEVAAFFAALEGCGRGRAASVRVARQRPSPFDEGASYCSSDHPLINAAVFVGDYQAADVVNGVYWLHYVPTRSPSQLAG
jgi:hypothetical protein